MNEALLAVISAAINAYMEQEEKSKAMPPRVMPYPEISSWRLFGRQELLRARTPWRVRRDSQGNTGLTLVRKEIQA